ncbi:Lactate utilization protein A [Lactococcus lactis]|nr:Lactate utilization protein A [Lactococcus lactis]
MKVSIFSTCVMDLMFPQVGIAMVEVLERLGIETDLPEEQICCGQPTYNSGLVKESMPTIQKSMMPLNHLYLWYSLVLLMIYRYLSYV